ncbi:MAG: hypothetical protein ACMXYD_05115 [Candidatus Woesearchaeota archaeon]
MIPTDTYEYTRKEEHVYDRLQRQNKYTRYALGGVLAALVIGLTTQKYHTQQAIENVTPKIELRMDKPCYINREEYTEVKACYHAINENS